MTQPAHSRTIRLEGVRVHNLKNVDVELSLHRLIVISGVSGSGKSSLAIDTLYAEGRRRYMECFSTYARQFLDRFEKPDADRIDHIPPAIAVRQQSLGLSAKSTIATATELHDYLRLLFAKIGRIICPGCETEIRTDTPADAADQIQKFDPTTRFQIAFAVPPDDSVDSSTELVGQLRQSGFTRVIIRDQTYNLNEETDAVEALADATVWVVVDRLVAGKVSQERLIESLEAAFEQGDDRCLILEERNGGSDDSAAEAVEIDGRSWRVHAYNRRLACETCQRDFVTPEPRLFSFNTPLGACETCQGFGSVPALSLDLLVPDRSKSLREGAIVAWTTPAYRHELDELLELADDYDIPVDIPFSQLEPQHLELITSGVPERDFGGLQGFFNWLERHKYKLPVRVFLNRWRAYEDCSECHGQRLQPLALAVRIDGENIADLCRRNIGSASQFFEQVVSRFSPDRLQLCRAVIDEINARLGYLKEVGLDYLMLDRTVRTLSGGEAQRVALTAALGSTLVNTLYVLDEPSAGLHPQDSDRVILCIRQLRDAGNTVVVVEHEDAFVRAADEVIDIGPGAGREGGRIVFQGPPENIGEAVESITGAYLSGRTTLAATSPESRRRPEHGHLKLEGARLNNLKNLTVEFPLGLLCVVTGVSGSGKSTLIQQTLYPAICGQLGQYCNVTDRGDCNGVTGVDQIDEVVLIDQTSVGRTPRSNSVTYMKAFDEIRQVFAKTPEAKVRNFTPTHFSFNATGGGRCPQCRGSGLVVIEMQFLADVSITCQECNGTRFQREILEIKYRGRNIAEVLAMTVNEAFTFFRSQPKLQRKLKFLKDVGLDYLPLGQPATTLSGGESQRLKLAASLASGSRSRSLFLIDEPTTGLHTADVSRLLDCFGHLIAVGHSLVIVEHNLDVIQAADYVIDLGPAAGDGGGEVVACGTPEQIAVVEHSITGHYLRERGMQRISNG